MLTERVGEIRKDFDKEKRRLARLKRPLWGGRAGELSNMIIDELLDNCDPTVEEFSKTMNDVIITSRGFYRCIFDGCRLRNERMF
jgi:hypothetical protein